MKNFARPTFRSAVCRVKHVSSSVCRCAPAFKATNAKTGALVLRCEGAKIGDDSRCVFFTKSITRHGWRSELARDILSRSEKCDGLGVGETRQSGDGWSKFSPRWQWNSRLEHNSGALKSFRLNGLSLVVHRRMTVAANADLLDEVAAVLKLCFAGFGL